MLAYLKYAFEISRGHFLVAVSVKMTISHTHAAAGVGIRECHTAFQSVIHRKVDILLSCTCRFRAFPRRYLCFAPVTLLPAHALGILFVMLYA